MRSDDLSPFSEMIYDSVWVLCNLTRRLYVHIDHIEDHLDDCYP